MIAYNHNSITVHCSQAHALIQKNCRAAEQGNAAAQFFLGVAYETGAGVPVDLAEAVSRYRRAAELGDVDAHFCLGIVYEDGIGVPVDLAESVSWYRRAAELGHVNSSLVPWSCLSDRRRCPGGPRRVGFLVPQSGGARPCRLVLLPKSCRSAH